MGSERADAVVVGSGPNGLCAAIVLARAGLQVLVLERADTIGGCARTAALTQPGFRHDVCSAVQPMAVGTPFLNSLPLAKHGLAWIHPPAPLAHPLDDRPAAMLERSLEDTARTLGRDGKAWTKWMRPWVRDFEKLVGDAMAPPGIPRHPIMMARFALDAVRSASAVAESRFRGAEARALFAGLASHSVMPLDMSPSAAIGFMLGIAGHAVGWPIARGGSQALSDALALHLAELGGSIETGVEVTALDAIPTDGPILFELAPVQVADIAGEALPGSFRARLRRFQHGPGVCKVDYALDGPIPWTDPAVSRAGTVHLGGTLDEIAAGERQVWDGTHAERPYVLLAQQSLFDDSRAPEGHHTVWAYGHVPNGSDEDQSARITAQIERFAPGFRDRILAQHVRTAAGFERYNPSYIGGDINIGAPALGQLLTGPAARLDPYTTPDPRLYLCSAATPPGGGVHGMCGVYAARTALRRWAPDR
jgi:phytoene dehydrogenase-like protein